MHVSVVQCGQASWSHMSQRDRGERSAVGFLRGVGLGGAAHLGAGPHPYLCCPCSWGPLPPCILQPPFPGRRASR